MQQSDKDSSLIQQSGGGGGDCWGHRCRMTEPAQLAVQVCYSLPLVIGAGFLR